MLSEFGPIAERLKPRTRAIATFALRGFANIPSIAILLGGLGSLVPERRQEIAKLGLKAVLAGTLATPFQRGDRGYTYHLNNAT